MGDAGSTPGPRETTFESVEDRLEGRKPELRAERPNTMAVRNQRLTRSASASSKDRFIA